MGFVGEIFLEKVPKNSLFAHTAHTEQGKNTRDSTDFTEVCAVPHGAFLRTRMSASRTNRTINLTRRRLTEKYPFKGDLDEQKKAGRSSRRVRPGILILIRFFNLYLTTTLRPPLM